MTQQNKLERLPHENIFTRVYCLSVRQERTHVEQLTVTHSTGKHLNHKIKVKRSSLLLHERKRFIRTEEEHFLE